MNAPKRTPLYDEHVKLGAKMVEFGGWEMPVSYKGIIEEHLAVRKNAGIFDIGHMGIIDIAGSDALGFINYIATNDASKLEPKQCQYSIVCNEHGGAVDDILVYRLTESFRIIVNASNTDKCLSWFRGHSDKFKDLSIVHRDDLCMLSLQGSNAFKLMGDNQLPEHNHCGVWQNYPFSRTGYTGEDGFEFFIDKTDAKKLWGHFIDLKVQPCGLGARDTLRLEAGLPLYGHEYNDDTSPLEAGYPWAVKFDKGDFVGKDALLKQKSGGLKKKLTGLKLHDRAIPRQGAIVKGLGVVTSGTFSPSLNIPIAMAYLKPGEAFAGKQAVVVIRGKEYPAVVTSKKMI